MTTTASVSPAIGEQLKRDGQDASARKVTPEMRATFFASIRALPAGQPFTANTLRAQWDADGIPLSVRAILMREARAAGLAEAVTFNMGGKELPLKIPSTGASAHRAFVCMYRRPVVHPEGR